MKGIRSTLERLLNPSNDDEQAAADQLFRAALSNRRNRRTFNRKMGRARGRGWTTSTHGPSRTRGGST